MPIPKRLDEFHTIDLDGNSTVTSRLLLPTVQHALHSQFTLRAVHLARVDTVKLQYFIDAYLLLQLINVHEAGSFLCCHMRQNGAGDKGR